MTHYTSWGYGYSAVIENEGGTILSTRSAKSGPAPIGNTDTSSTVAFGTINFNQTQFGVDVVDDTGGGHGYNANGGSTCAVAVRPISGHGALAFQSPPGGPPL